MIAKISVGNSLYGALSYNQHKIDEGEGRVLCSNKMTEREDGLFDIHSCLKDFDRQIPKDINTEKPIMHISLNPHPDDVLSDDKLTDIAEEYMQKMGYGNQPYMVYKHEDIERHHIHIVALRVDETGRKIADSNNFYKSKDITREIEKKYKLHAAEKKKQAQVFDFKKINPDKGNIKVQLANVVKPLAALYHFQSFNEYRTLLSRYNIHVQEVKGEAKGRAYNGLMYQALDESGGKVGNPLKSSLFGKPVGYNAIQEKYEQTKMHIKNKRFKEQTRQRINAVLSKHPDRKSFEKELTKAGVDVVFRENESGRIYGVTFIDHMNHCVFNGSRLGKELAANTFEQHFTTPQIYTHTETDSDTKTEANQAIEQTNDGYIPPVNYEDGLLSGIFDLLSMDNDGMDPEEGRFIRELYRKQRKKTRRKL